jgi:hypothetical protein
MSLRGPPTAPAVNDPPRPEPRPPAVFAMFLVTRT